MNYFLGNNPRHWRTNIPTYAKVIGQSVYPGVDVVTMETSSSSNLTSSSLLVPTLELYDLPLTEPRRYPLKREVPWCYAPRQVQSVGRSQSFIKR